MATSTVPVRKALQGLSALYELPLFLVDTQRPVRKVNHINRLVLMGESNEPIPEEIAVSDFLSDDKKLYVGTTTGALLVYPMLIWGLERDRAAQSLYLIDKVANDSLIYNSLAAFNPPNESILPQDLLRVLDGELVPIETITFHDGRTFLEAWGEKRKLMITSTLNFYQNIDWAELDKQTLQWYSTVLKAKVNSDAFDAKGIKLDWNNPAEVIRQILLDGRGEFTPDEMHQLILLFGTSINIRRQIKRDILDLRASFNPEGRWNEREELTENVLQALRKTIDFITHYNPIEGLSTENLQAPTGSADYVAVREALINLIIHQDYKDQRTVAQIELVPHRTIMVNAGASLVSQKDLMNGRTSTARNPLIARALKLIGFAELAGSGLREVSRVWRNAKRRPPIIESDDQNNRFRIELDSRPLKIIADAFWKKRLGVTISPEAARILGLLGNAPAGMTLAEICSGTGASSDDALVMCQGLQKQMLIDFETEKYQLKSHLLDLAREAPEGS